MHNSYSEAVTGNEIINSQALSNNAEQYILYVQTPSGAYSCTAHGITTPLKYGITMGPNCQTHIFFGLFEAFCILSCLYCSLLFI